MTIRWTQRPQNYCRTCGYTWYPRGKNRSANCPRCRSQDVELVLEEGPRAIGYLITAPFVLIGLILEIVIDLIVSVVGGAFSVLHWMFRLSLRVLIGGTRAGGMAAQWSADKAAPAGSWLV